MEALQYMKYEIDGISSFFQEPRSLLISCESFFLSFMFDPQVVVGEAKRNADRMYFNHVTQNKLNFMAASVSFLITGFLLCYAVGTFCTLIWVLDFRWTWKRYKMKLEAGYLRMKALHALLDFLVNYGRLSI